MSRMEFQHTGVAITTPSDGGAVLWYVSGCAAHLDILSRSSLHLPMNVQVSGNSVRWRGLSPSLEGRAAPRCRSPCPPCTSAAPFREDDSSRYH